MFLFSFFVCDLLWCVFMHGVGAGSTFSFASYGIQGFPSMMDFRDSTLGVGGVSVYRYANGQEFGRGALGGYNEHSTCIFFKTFGDTVILEWGGQKRNEKVRSSGRARSGKGIVGKMAGD